jgi:hypothetical protein
MGDSNIDGDGGEDDGDVGGVDGDGSGGTSPSLQGAGTETYVPRNWSLMAAALRNFTGRNAERFRVFASETLYRRRGDVRGGQGPHTIGWRDLGSTRATLGCGWSLAPLRLSFGLRLVSGKIGGSGFVSSNSKNINCVTFLKHKNSRKQGTGTVASRQ